MLDFFPSRRKRIRLVRQTEIAECGLACITMIANSFGFGTNLSAMRRHLAISNRGTTFATLIEIADRGDYTKVTYLHAKGEQIRYDASRCYSQAFLPLLCGAALRAPIWEGGNPIDQRSR